MSTKGSSKSPNKSASEEGSKGKKKSSKSSDEKSDKSEKKSRSSSSSSSSGSSEEDSKYTHPPFKMLVSEAIFENNAATTKKAIEKFISSNYNVDEDRCGKNVSRTVKKMVKNKELTLVPNTRKYKFQEKWKAAYMKQTGRKAPKKKTRKPAVPKDPDQPKKPKNAWNYYSTKMRTDLKKKYPSLEFGEISKKLSKRWHDLEDRSEWEDLAKKDKKRYEKEMKVYTKGKEEKKKRRSSKRSSSSESSSESETSSERKKRKEKEKKKRKEKEKKKDKMDTSDDESKWISWFP